MPLKINSDQAINDLRTGSKASGLIPNNDREVIGALTAADITSSATDISLMVAIACATASDPAATENIANYTGSSPTDNVTSHDTLIGLGNPDAVVPFTLDGNPTAATDGIHTIVASETDAGGNTGIASPIFMLDTTVLANGIESSAIDNITLTSDDTLPGLDNPNATVQFAAHDDASVEIATANGSGGIVTPISLSNGPYIILASETDAVGNTSAASDTLAFTINAVTPVPPTIAAFSPDTGFVGSGVTSSGQAAQAGAGGTGMQLPIVPSGAQPSNFQINVIFDQPIASLPSGFVSAVNYAVSYFESLFTNSATITIHVGYGEIDGSALAGNALGESMSTNYVNASYSSVKSALLAQNAPGASTLPSTSPLGGSLYMPQAEAKALGLSPNDGSLDGYVGFSNTVSWDYTTAAPSGGQYFLIGVIEHEFTEIMGRVSFINYQPSDYTPMDLFRYTASGTRDLTAGGSGSLAYFSVDGGQTLLKSWNNNPNNGDLGDWYGQGGNDAANDYTSSGVISTFSATDITNMQALGWTGATGPAAPTITSFSPDSGTVGDGVTNATVLTLAGTAVAGSTVNLYDGATLIGTVLADGSGAWSLPTGTLGNGPHSFTATDTVSGTTSAASAALNVTVDTVAPTGGTPDLVAGSDSGSSSTDNLTNALSPTFTVALNSTVAAGDIVQLLLGGSALAHNVLHTITAADVTAGSVSLAVTAGDLGADGAKSISAKFTDAAGNSSTTSALSVTLDTAGPSETISATIGTDTGSTTTITSGGLTKDNTLALSGTVSDVNGVSSVHVFDGATDLGAATIVGGNWNFTTLGLTDGTHSFTAKAVDTAGNTTTTAPVTATVDATTPTGGTPDLVAGSDSGTSQTDNLTNATSPTFTVALNSTVAAGDIVQLLLGGSALAHNVLHTITAADVTAGSVSLAVTAGDLGADGAKSISAKFTDAAGNSSTTSALSVTLDTAGPSETISATIGTDTGSTTTITSGGLTKDNTLALSGTVSDTNGVSSVHVFDGATDLGAATIVGGNWNFTTLGLTDGTHSLTAKAVDTAGNTTTTAAVTATVDTTAPSETISATIGTDTGSTTTITSGGLTKDNTLALSGTVSDVNGVTSVHVFDGATDLGAATIVGGNWSFTTLGLTDGTHSLTAKAVDTAGNTTTTAAVTATVDTTAPSETISATIGTNTGSTTTITSGGLTKDNTLALSGTVNDVNGVTSVHVFDGATDLGAATIVGGNWNFTTLALTDGTHSLTAKAVDTAGNTTTTAAVTATVDTTAPSETISTTIGTNTGSTTTITSGGLTKDNTLALSGTVSDVNGVTSVHVFDGATDLGAATIVGGNWNFTTLALTDGTHSLTAKAVDTAGNTTTTAAVTATVDTTTPTGGMPALTVASDSGTSHSDNLTNVTSPTFTVALNSTVAAGDTVQLLLGGSALAHNVLHTITAADVTAGSVSLAVTAGDLGADGAKSISAKFTDAAGNSSTTSALAVTLDTTAPLAPVITTTAPAQDNASLITINGTAEANSSVTLYNNGVSIGTVVTDGTGHWSVPNIALTDNTNYSFTAKATDAAGNTSPASTALAFHDDQTAPLAPVITTTAPAQDNASLITINGTAEASSSVTLYNNGVSIGTVMTDGTGHWSVSGIVLTNGADYSFTAKATDAAGNSSGASNALAFHDNQIAPSILIATIAGDNTINATEAATGFLISGTTSNVEDGQTATIQIVDSSNTVVDSFTATVTGNAWSLTVPSTDHLADGSYTVKADVSNLAGTAATEATRVITVDETAPAAPTVALANDTGSSSSDHITSNGLLTVTPAEAGGTIQYSTDGGVNWTGSFTAVEGANNVAVRQVDAAGNNGTAALFSFTLDTTKPTGGTPDLVVGSDSGSSSTDNLTNAISPTFTVALNSTVVAGDIVQLLLGGSALAHNVLHTITAADVTAGSVSLSVTAGDLGADGAKSISAKFTDAAGNSSTTSALSVTLDTTGPSETISATIGTNTGSTTTITSGGLTKDNTLALSGTVSDVNGVTSVHVFDGATDLGAATIVGGNWNFTTLGLTDGSHSFTAKAVDTAGNTTTTAAVTATVDTTAPSETISTTIGTNTGSTTTITSGGLTKDNTLALSGTVNDVNGVTSVHVFDGATDLGAATIVGGNWNFTTLALTDGTHSLTAKAVDTAGNTTTTAAVTATVDTTAPSETISTTIGTNTGSTTTITSGGLTKDNTLALSGTVSDVNGVTSVHVFDGATDLGAATIVGGNWNFTTLALTDGTHSLTAKAVDTAGNTTTTAAVTATVDTTTPTGGMPALTVASDSGTSHSDNLTNVTSPTFTVALNSTVAAGDTVQLLLGGSALAHNVLHTITAADVTAGSVSLAVTAGDLGADGAKSISAKFTDAAGNSSTTSALAVTLDTTPPAAPTVALASDTGSSSSDHITSNGLLTVTPAEAGGTIQYSTNGGTSWTGSFTAVEGANSVQVRQVDAAGNNGTAALFSFTLDTTPPAAPTVALASDTGSSGSDHITSSGLLTVTPAEAGGTIQYSTNGGTSWTGSFTAVEGANNVAVRQVDAAGNNGTATSFSFTLDTTAPSETISATIGTDTGSTTTITSGGLTKDNTLALSGTVSDVNGVTSVHVFDGATDLGAATIVGGNWNFTTLGLTDGTHSFTAKAVDTAGNTTTTAAVTATVDTTMTVIEAYGSTSLVEAANHYYLDNSSWSGPSLKYIGADIVAGGFGAWTPIGVEQTANGYEVAWHNTVTGLYTAWNTDSNGNYVSNLIGAVSGTSTALESLETSFYQDLNGDGVIGIPGLMGGTLGLVAGSDSGSSNTDNLTNVTSPTFTVALNSTVVAGDIVQLLLGGSALAHNVLHTITAADVTAGSVSLSVTAGDLGADGAKSISAKFTDAAGNSSTTAADVITLDTTAPSETISATIGTDTGSTTTITSGGLTKDNTLALSGTVSDVNGVTSVHVFDGATDLGAATIVGGNWNFTTLALTDGSHSFTAKAVDTAGNTTTTAAVTATVDTTTPTGGTPDLVAGSDSGSSSTDNLTNVTSPTFTVALNSTVAAGDNVQLLLGGSALAHNVTHTITAADVTAGSVSLAVTAGDLGADGAKPISAKFTDAAGNSSTTSALAVTLDTTAPVVNESLTTDTGSSASDKITASDALTGSGDANAVVTLKEGSTTLGTTTANASGAWSFTPTGLAEGVHTIVASETDAAGNTGSSSFTFTLDNTGPSETISATIGTDTGSTTTITSGGLTKDNTLALSGTVSDVNGVTSVHVFDGATDLGAATIVGGNWNFTTLALTDGTHSLTAKAVDTAGNTTTTAAVTATVDTTAPSETISATIGTDTGATPTITSGGLTNDNTLALSGTVSDVNGVTSVHVFDGATDLGAATVNAGNWSLTTNALSNSTHSFTAVATDAAGNTTTTAAVTATVNTAVTVIEAYGSTSLVEAANHYYLDNSSWSGPSLKYIGADIVAGGFGAWTPIGVEQTANGYEVAWHNTVTGLYTAWNTDSNGNYVSNLIGAVSGTSTALESLETSFYQDLNGDGVIGVPVSSGLAQTLGSMTGAGVDTAIAITASSFASDSSGQGLLTGRAEPNSAISIYDDNTGTHLGQTTTDSFGTWSVLMGKLSNTVHSVTATASDHAGGTGSIHAVIGTAGNDIITNNAPNEVFFGNGGADTFVFSGNIGNSTIADFHVSNDVVQLNHNVFSSVADVLAHATQVGSDVTITLDAADSITLHNTMLAHLTAGSFHLV